MCDFLVKEWNLQYDSLVSRYFFRLNIFFFRDRKAILHDRSPHHFHRASPPEVHEVIFHSSLYLVLHNTTPAIPPAQRIPPADPPFRVFPRIRLTLLYPFYLHRHIPVFYNVYGRLYAVHSPLSGIYALETPNDARRSSGPARVKHFMDTG